jgi:thioredoxin 2
VVIVCPNCAKKNRVPAAASGRPRCAQCHENLPWIAEAGDADFSTVVEKASVPVVVDLWAPWYRPCRMISPALDDVTARLRGRMKLVKVNVDESPATARRFGVQGIPTLLMFRHGQRIDRSVGAQGAGQLQAWIEPLLTDTG